MKTRYKAVPTEVMEKVRERSQGICEYCGMEKATQPHHIHLKSQGGLDIPINILYVCYTCHNHNNVQFLHYAKKVLKQRIDTVFDGHADMLYPDFEIAERLDMNIDKVLHEMTKGFLQNYWHNGGQYSTKEQIERWLGLWL
jgi:hypothetical protein